MKILIAEDEQDMLKIIKLYLEKEGYQISVATDGKQAFDMICNDSYDLLISDWMMPVMDGVELCKEIRSTMIPIKIIMLTAKSDISDEITGLKCGADDYIKKPFEPQLLLLKIKKMFQLENEIKCGEITFNPDKHSAYINTVEINLTIKELMLLEYLIKNKGVTISRDKLIEQVWGVEYEGDERTLDTHIRRLRNKIGPNYIKTFVGTGYRMDELNE